MVCWPLPVRLCHCLSPLHPGAAPPEPLRELVSVQVEGAASRPEISPLVGPVSGATCLPGL